MYGCMTGFPRELAACALPDASATCRLAETAVSTNAPLCSATARRDSSTSDSYSTSVITTWQSLLLPHTPPQTVHNIFCGKVEKRVRMEDLPVPTDVVLHIAKIIAIIYVQRVARGFLVRERLLRICEGRIYVEGDEDAASYMMNGH